MNDEIEKYLLPKNLNWKEPISKDDAINELIRIAIGHEIPSLFSTIEIEGIIIKDYLFISGSVSKADYPDAILDKEFKGKDYLQLAIFKNELEEQLKTNRKHCLSQYQEIKKIVSDWIKRKLLKIETALSSGEVDAIVFYDCMFSLNIFFSLMMHGEKIDVIKKHVSFSCTTQVYSESVGFDQNEFFKLIEEPFKTIYRVIERSLPIYYRYIKLQSLLYKIEPSLIFEKYKSLKSEEVYDQILNAPEGIRAGKIAFVEHIKNVFDQRTDMLAFIKANQIHKRFKGKPIYKHENSYYSSKSQVNMEIVYKILNRIK